MKYILTLVNDQGFMHEEQLDLPVTDNITWADFINLRQVRDCLLMHPSMRLLDVTPDGMPNIYTDEQQRINQLGHINLAKEVDRRGAPVYTTTIV
jgi:hypothetical protein